MNIITASFANLDIKQPSSLEGSVQPLIIIDEIPGIRYPPSWLSPPSSPSDNDWWEHWISEKLWMKSLEFLGHTQSKTDWDK